MAWESEDEKIPASAPLAEAARKPVSISYHARRARFWRTVMSLIVIVGSLLIAWGCASLWGETAVLELCFAAAVLMIILLFISKRRNEVESRKLALVASRTNNAVIITDALGRIEWVNEGFTRITGYGIAEVLGRKPGSFLQGILT